MSDDVIIVGGPTVPVRKIVWTVGEDGKTVTPAAVQDGGVQGDDNATEVVFLPPMGLTDSAMTYYIECIDSLGGYDKTAPISLYMGQIIQKIPLAWTQHGGVITLRLVCQREGQTVYTLEGRLRFAGRPTATRRVDSLLKTEIQQTLDAAREAVVEAEQAAIGAAADATAAADGANQAGAYAAAATAFAEEAATAADAATGAAETARKVAETATAAEERIKTLAVPDDSTVRRDGLWSSMGTVERLCPPFEKSGGAVTVYPVEGYPLAVQTAEPTDYLNLDYELEEYDGLRITRTADGGYRLDGTMGAGGCLYLDCPVGTLAEAFGLDPAVTYRLSGCPAGGSAAGYRLELWEDSSGEVRAMDTGAGAAFVPADYDYRGIWILSVTMPTGTVCDGLIFRPRITVAADTPTTVTRCGKNLLPYPYNTPTQTKAGITFAANEDGSVTISGTFEEGVTGGTDATVCRTPVKHLIGETIAIPIFYTNGIRMFVHMRYVDGTTKFNWLSSKLTSTRTNTDIIPENADFIMVGLAVETPYTGETTTVYPQLELGDAPTVFEPYREPQTFPVAPDGTATVPAAAGCNTLWADAGDVTVAGRLDPIRILQGLMGGGDT